MNSDKTAFVCPTCGEGDSITETNKVYADYPVTAWDENGEPADYDAATVLWDTAEALDSDRYHCTACDALFDEPKPADIYADTENDIYSS